MPAGSPPPTPAPPALPAPPSGNHRNGSDDSRSSSGDTLPRTSPSPFPERTERNSSDSNHDDSPSPQPLHYSPPSPPSYAHQSAPQPPSYYGSNSPHRPRGHVHDIDDFDSFGNMRLRNNHSPRRSRHRRRRNRHRPEFWDVPPAFSPPPPVYHYHPVSGYQESDHPFPMSPYAPTGSYTPYPSYVPQHQALMPPPYQPPIPPRYQPAPYPSSMYPSPSPSSLQPPPPDAYHPNHRHFRTVQHRFAGWVFNIRTDAAPGSKKLKVKRVGDSVEYYCSGVLLTKLRYKLQRDIFHLYEDPSADRSALPFTDPELCSKIEILMACIVADLFEPPWDMNDFDIAWGVSECHDIGDGNSVLVSVTKETTGSATMMDSLSRRSSMAGVTASPYRLERRCSGPLVPRLDAFQRIGSYDRSRGFHSPSGPNILDRSQVVAVLRHVELITARQLANQSYLQSSEVASVIGTKKHLFFTDHVYGRFDATVPTLFGLLVSKLQGLRRRPIPSHEYYDSLYTASDDSDSSNSLPFSPEHNKAVNKSETEPPELVIVGGGTNSGHDYNDYPSGMEPAVGGRSNSEDESQESGDDPFSQQGNNDTDTDNSMESVLLLPPNEEPSRYPAEEGKDLWLPGTRPEKHKSKPEHGFGSSDNMVSAFITSAPPAAPPSGVQDAVPLVDRDALPPLPGYTKEIASRNDLGDNVASLAQGETTSPRTGMKVAQSSDERSETRTSTHTDLTQHSEQESSVAAATKHQDVDGQDAFEPLRLENKFEQHDRDDMSGDEGQTQAPGLSNILNGLKMLTKEDEAVQCSGSVHQQEDFDGRNELAEPDRETGNTQVGSDDMSGSEGETEGKDARDEGKNLKPILRPPGEPSRNNGTSYHVKFRLPSPEQTLTEEELRQREHHEERRNEWNERRRDDERGCYPPRPHAPPHQSSSPSSLPTRPGMDYYASPSEGPAYKEAVNAGHVYERPFEDSQAQDAPQRRSSKNTDIGSTYSIDLEPSFDFAKPPLQNALSDDEFQLPTPVTSRRSSRLTRLNSRLSRKLSSGSSDESSKDRRARTSHRSGKNNPAQHVAKELLTVVLGGIIVILSVLAVVLDPAEEGNWFKRIEQGIFVMFSLGIPFLVAMTSKLSENLEILTPETERDVRSLRDLQNMNQGMEYDEFVKQLQKAVLLDEDLSALFSFKNACYKLSRKSGKLVIPSYAVYSKTFKMVWFFGEDLAFNRILGKVFRYRHENNVLYIDKEPVDIEGVVVHVRRRVGNYSLSSAPET